MQFNEAELNTAVDQLESLDLDEQELQAHAAAAVDPVTKICMLYQKVRPFLLLIATLFFIPRKWQDAVRTFTQSLDLICPGG